MENELPKKQIGVNRAHARWEEMFRDHEANDPDLEEALNALDKTTEDLDTFLKSVEEV